MTEDNKDHGRTAYHGPCVIMNPLRAISLQDFLWRLPIKDKAIKREVIFRGSSVAILLTELLESRTIRDAGSLVYVHKTFSQLPTWQRKVQTIAGTEVAKIIDDVWTFLALLEQENYVEMKKYGRDVRCIMMAMTVIDLVIALRSKQSLEDKVYACELAEWKQSYAGAAPQPLEDTVKQIVLKFRKNEHIEIKFNLPS